MIRPLSRSEMRRVAELQLALKQIDDAMKNLRARRLEAQEVNTLMPTESP
jgi:hypothetical protein